MDFYVDGKFLNSAPINSGDLYMIEEGGELVVGQDQDCMLGCYQVNSTAFSGNRGSQLSLKIIFGGMGGTLKS